MRAIDSPQSTDHPPFSLGPVQRFREHAQEFIGGLVAVLTILGFFLLLPWPTSLIVALLIVIAFLGYLLWRIAPPRIHAGDQERLNDLLRILNRRAEESIAVQDFYARWNGQIMNPIKVFVFKVREWDQIQENAERRAKKRAFRGSDGLT